MYKANFQCKCFFLIIYLFDKNKIILAKKRKVLIELKRTKQKKRANKYG